MIGVLGVDDHPGTPFSEEFHGSLRKRLRHAGLVFDQVEVKDLADDAGRAT